jgi:hypothetical protein
MRTQKDKKITSIAGKLDRFEIIHYALRDLEYATSLTIDLLKQLDLARIHIRVLKEKEDGRMVVCPANCLPLNAAVEQAFYSCRNIK